MKNGVRMTARVIEGPDQPVIVTRVDDIPTDHGPGEYVTLRWNGERWVEEDRFGS